MNLAESLETDRQPDGYDGDIIKCFSAQIGANAAPERPIETYENHTFFATDIVGAWMLDARTRSSEGEKIFAIECSHIDISYHSTPPGGLPDHKITRRKNSRENGLTPPLRHMIWCTRKQLAHTKFRVNLISIFHCSNFKLSLVNEFILVLFNRIWNAFSFSMTWRTHIRCDFTIVFIRCDTHTHTQTIFQMNFYRF